MCKDCFYYRKKDNTEGRFDGFCHFEPPKVIVIDWKHDFPSAIPQVTEDHFCSKFESVLCNRCKKPAKDCRCARPVGDKVMEEIDMKPNPAEKFPEKTNFYDRFWLPKSWVHEMALAINNMHPINIRAEKLHMARMGLIWTLKRVVYKKSGYFDVELERTRKVLATSGKVIRFD